MACVARLRKRLKTRYYYYFIIVNIYLYQCHVSMWVFSKGHNGICLLCHPDILLYIQWRIYDVGGGGQEYYNFSYPGITQYQPFPKYANAGKTEHYRTREKSPSSLFGLTV